jgi:peptide/nickel transport system permease protein
MANATPAISMTAVSPRRGGHRLRQTFRVIRRKPLGVAGGLIVVGLLAIGILADVVAPYSYSETNILSALQKPSFDHVFGTDDLGRDVFSRVVYGTRISVIIGLAAVTIGTLGALVLGMLSAYAGGIADLVIQRLVDGWISFPGLVILLTLVSIFQPGILTLVIALALGEIFRGSRIFRASVLTVMNQSYVEAARALGCSHARIILRYIVPNVMAVIIVLATVGLGSVILAEATLSFLGLGIPPPYPSWGRMLSGQGALYFYAAPWIAIFPGLAISLAVFGFNMFGDALRDLLDPRLRGV